MPKLPPQQAVPAMEAAKNLKTPLDILEVLYGKHLMATNPGSLFIALPSLVFGDLEGMATKAIKATACVWRHVPVW